MQRSYVYNRSGTHARGLRQEATSSPARRKGPRIRGPLHRLIYGIELRSRLPSHTGQLDRSETVGQLGRATPLRDSRSPSRDSSGIWASSGDGEHAPARLPLRPSRRPSVQSHFESIDLSELPHLRRIACHSDLFPKGDLMKAVAVLNLPKPVKKASAIARSIVNAMTTKTFKRARSSRGSRRGGRTPSACAPRRKIASATGATSYRFSCGEPRSARIPWESRPTGSTNTCIPSHVRPTGQTNSKRPATHTSIPSQDPPTGPASSQLPWRVNPTGPASSEGAFQSEKAAPGSRFGPSGVVRIHGCRTRTSAALAAGMYTETVLPEVVCV